MNGPSSRWVPSAGTATCSRGLLSEVSILLVDDDDLSRCALMRMLQRRGARVQSFSHAEPALAAARAEPPNLVVVDLELPGMTGFEAATSLAASPLTADVPVLAISGHSDPRTRAAALAAGAHEFLAKPCTIDELEAVVARLARHRGIGPAWEDGGAARGTLQALVQAIVRAAGG